LKHQWQALIGHEMNVKLQQLRYENKENKKKMNSPNAKTINHEIKKEMKMIPDIADTFSLPRLELHHRCQ
jgi:hypothetical protein